MAVEAPDQPRCRRHATPCYSPAGLDAAQATNRAGGAGCPSCHLSEEEALNDGELMMPMGAELATSICEPSICNP